MIFKTCPICKKIRLHYKSESGIAGACYRCRDSIIPKHILLKQHKQYIKLYLQKRS